MAGFKGGSMTLSVSDAALARRTAELVGEQMRMALAEDRLIRTGQMQEWAKPEGLNFTSS